MGLRKSKIGILRWKGWFDVVSDVGGHVYQDVAENQLYDQGERDMIELFFLGSDAGYPAPISFQLGLLDATYVPTETDTMTEIVRSELDNTTCPGYGTTTARKSIARGHSGWPTALRSAGNWRLTSASVTWRATGSWWKNAGFMFLVVNGTTERGNTTGRVVAVAPLAPVRPVRAVNDTVTVSYNVSLA